MIGFCTLTNAQEEQIVTLTVIGQGKSKEEAKQVALQNAIEQTYGTFISSKKEIINNKVTKDEFVLASNGNIKQNDIISEIEIPNIGFVVTLKVIVSITKLTEFSESKGEVIEFKGGIFSQKIKLQKLNEAAENIAIRNLCLSSFEILKNAVNFEVQHSEPQMVGEDKGNYDKNINAYSFSDKFGYYLNEVKPDDYKIIFTVNAKQNDNYFVFMDYFKKTIQSLSMTSEEAKDYENLNKIVSQVIIDDSIYYLRNEQSIKDLHNLFIRSNIIPSTFKITSNIRELNFLLMNRYLKDNYSFNNLKSFVNVETISTVYAQADYSDEYKYISEKILHSSNIYPFYQNFFTPILNFFKEETVINYIDNTRKIEIGDLAENLENRIKLNTKEINSVTFTFDEYFTLNEIEKIDAFKIEQLDFIKTLKEEEERLKKLKLVQLAGGGYEPYEDFYGNKFNNYGDIFGDGATRTTANLIEIQKNKVLVKVYITKNGSNSFWSNNGNPGKLYYVPIGKVVKYLDTNNFKNKKGELSFQYN